MSKTTRVINRLSFRIFVPVALLMLMSGVGLYLFFHHVASDFTERIIKNSLDEKAADIYAIVDRGLDELIKSGQSDNQQSIRIKRALTISEMEDAMRQNDLRGVILQEGKSVMTIDDVSAEMVAALPSGIKDNTITPVTRGKETYYLYMFDFEPWQWRIYLLKNSSEYAALIQKVQQAYMTAGLFLILATLLFIYYLNRNINRPISRIVSSLKRAEKPDYTGIQEFENLSNDIGSILTSLKQENERLVNIYQIAISRRGKVFFEEVAVTLSRMLELNAGISRLNISNDTLHVLAMSLDGQLVSDLDIALQGTPCHDTLNSRQMLVIESEAADRYPQAGFLAEHQIESYACIPVCSRKGDIIGLISVFGNKHAYSDSDKMLLQTMGQMVAAEFELLEKTVYLDNILHSSTDTAIISTDVDLNITYFNPAAERILGYNQQDIVGNNVASIHEKLGIVFEKLKQGLMTVGSKGEHQFTFIHKHNGALMHIDARIYPMTDENGRLAGYVLMARDISDYKQLEEQLLHSQKLEAVGLLAGGVAHEFNNILMSIMGYAGLLKMKYTEEGPLKKYIEYIISSSEKAAKLTQGLLAFSRKQIINPKTYNLNEIIRDAEHLLMRAIHEDIELRIIIHNDDLRVIADKGQIEQVLLNLATNARDAMPAGGRLSIETSAVHISDENLKKHYELDKGNYVLISISDNGIGMDEITREHIFEPFFTSKEVGKGTGLGLSVVFGIIKQHNGSIKVYSEPGKGTTFKILIPQSNQPIAQDGLALETCQPLDGKETMLLVEDDPQVVSLVTEVLEEHGYQVIYADSQDALKVFESHQTDISLLLLDVVMPQKSGKQVYDEIKTIQPEIKALFMSGYTADIINRMGILDEQLEFISKPVSPRELLTKIRDLLDR